MHLNDFTINKPSMHILFIHLIIHNYDRTVYSRQEVKWEKERERDGIRKCPQARIRTWDTRNATTLYIAHCPRCQQLFTILKNKYHNSILW